MLEGRKRVPPNGAFAPFVTFFPALVGSAHRLPGDPLRMADVFRGALPALLMNQIEIAEGRFLMRIPFEQGRLSDEFVGGCNRIVAGIGNLSGSVFVELIVVELKQANIRSGALLGIEIRLDLGNRFHEAEIEAESVGRAL